MDVPVIGAILLVTVLWLVWENKKGTHKHKCPSCDTVWQHGGLAVFVPGAHECPECGTKEHYHYVPDRE